MVPPSWPRSARRWASSVSSICPPLMPGTVVSFSLALCLTHSHSLLSLRDVNLSSFRMVRTRSGWEVGGCFLRFKKVDLNIMFSLREQPWTVILNSGSVWLITVWEGTHLRLCLSQILKTYKAHVLSFREQPQTAFLKNGSEWLRTKWEGELAVRNEFPEATIFRCPGTTYIQRFIYNMILKIWKLTKRGISFNSNCFSLFTVLIFKVIIISLFFHLNMFFLFLVFF